MKTNPEALKQAIRILCSIEGLNVTQTLQVNQAVDILDNHMEQQERIHLTNQVIDWDEIMKADDEKSS